MDAVLKLLLDDVPGAKLKYEIVDKNIRLGRVFNYQVSYMVTR